MSESVAQIIILVIQIILIIASILVVKFLPANKVQKAKAIIDILAQSADDFVHGARQFLNAKTGEEKLNYVVDELEKLAIQNNWNISTEQLRSMAQHAYDKMKKDEQK